MGHASTAMRVREAKERKPEDFCANPRCLAHSHGARFEPLQETSGRNCPGASADSDHVRCAQGALDLTRVLDFNSGGCHVRF
jgi:hypothetical protein